MSDLGTYSYPAGHKKKVITEEKKKKEEEKKKREAKAKQKSQVDITDVLPKDSTRSRRSGRK